ncbi:TIGR04283 family arsenosugar biosynthesis glycosyltransferase [Thalassobius aquimarinus]|uniref:TIGR04283 family arsenosugar biosynthesis glycosyltransferase n=1 Tax=Thalassovita aquimarina TaxID=2785917 RepID=A0ABS5HTF5_9RHOB|nr:TIGR04283 family arsenosugar biosynthesis glycosyltransferase [Thalassovita aquimarina]
MRAALSVIIPTLNAEKQLPACLSALMEGLEAGLVRELVISDGGSSDATLRIADEVGAVVIASEASRGGQLRRGMQAAQGDWLLVLHADTVLDPGWSESVLDHIAAHPERAGYFRLRFDAAGLAPRVVAGWANFRARFFGLPYGDQGLLISRDLYDGAGGFDDQPLMEDVAMARQLRGQLRQIPVTARTSAARYVKEGWFRRGGRNLWILLRYLSGADPRDLARSYRRSGPRS